MRKRKEKKKATKMFHGMRACFRVTCMHVAYPDVCLCIMEKKEKTAYLEYMFEKSFGIIKSNISEVQLIKTVTNQVLRS